LLATSGFDSKQKAYHFDSFILDSITIVYTMHHTWGWVGWMVVAKKFVQVMEKNKIAA